MCLSFKAPFPSAHILGHDHNCHRHHHHHDDFHYHAMKMWGCICLGVLFPSVHILLYWLCRLLGCHHNRHLGNSHRQHCHHENNLSNLKWYLLPACLGWGGESPPPPLSHNNNTNPFPCISFSQAINFLLNGVKWVHDSHHNFMVLLCIHPPSLIYPEGGWIWTAEAHVLRLALRLDCSQSLSYLYKYTRLHLPRRNQSEEKDMTSVF